MIVENPVPFNAPSSSQMNRPDAPLIERRDDAARIEAKVRGIRVKVVEIEQEIGSGGAKERRRATAFVVVRERRIDERRHILEQRKQSR